MGTVGEKVTNTKHARIPHRGNMFAKPLLLMATWMTTAVILSINPQVNTAAAAAVCRSQA